MRRILAFTVIFSLAMVIEASAHSRTCSMFPPNKLRFPVRNNGKQMTAKQFRKILDASEAVYQPIFKELGLRFYVENRWHDDEVNACASIGSPCSKFGESTAATKDFRYIEIYGGLGRHPEMSPEGLLLVICHEIGHHLAGYPRYGENTEVMSTEGQSDYFATAKCARSIFEKMSPKTHKNWAWANRNRIPKEVAKPCAANFPNPESDDAIYCARSSIAGLSLAKTLASLGSTPPESLSFTQKDPNVVTETYESHPEAQCRLDTYVAGALCPVHHDVAFGFSNPVEGACVNPKDGASRPKCWYKEPVARRRR